MKILKLLYKPFAIIAGIVGSMIGRQIFKTVWARIDAEEPPKATTPDVPLGKVVGARALEAATMAGVGAAVDRAGLNSFRYLTGVWAGKTDEPEEEKKD
jgi:xanthosine utilization system XapX-like protein